MIFFSLKIRFIGTRTAVRRTPSIPWSNCWNIQTLTRTNIIVLIVCNLLFFAEQASIPLHQPSSDDNNNKTQNEQQPSSKEGRSTTASIIIERRKDNSSGSTRESFKSKTTSSGVSSISSFLHHFDSNEQHSQKIVFPYSYDDDDDAIEQSIQDRLCYLSSRYEYHSFRSFTG